MTDEKVKQIRKSIDDYLETVEYFSRGDLNKDVFPNADSSDHRIINKYLDNLSGEGILDYNIPKGRYSVEPKK